MEFFQERPRSPSPEHERTPEQILAAVQAVLHRREAMLIRWEETSDAEVNEVKNDLKEALGIPSTEHIIVAVGGHPDARSGMRIWVSSATNALQRYLIGSWNRASSHLSIHPRSSEGWDSLRDETIVRALRMPEITGRTSLRHTEHGDVTEYQVIHHPTEKVLGTVTVDEKAATIVRVRKNADAIQEVVPKSLKECMAVLAKEGRIRDPYMRRTVEDAIRRELDLPPAFAQRGLLITATENGSYLDITVEDKESEQVIAHVEYHAEFGEFSSRMIHHQVIKRILGVRPETRW